jgi:peptidoglycan/LPS O-acetylase OafA/YrhL
VTARRREPGLDVLRGVAVLGVVLGHWLVTAPLAPDPATGAVRLDSPLRTMPVLAPASWALQTLGLFCVVAGFAAARSWDAAPDTAVRWWWVRLRRLAGPAGALLGAVALAVVVLGVAGAPQSLVLRVVKIVTTPLWFLGVHVVLSAATPLLARLDSRARGGGVVAAVVVALSLPALTGGSAAPVAVLAAWWVPWQLGIVMARRPLRWPVATALLVGGVATVAVLVATGTVPPTAVGVPGGGPSNLDPPTGATVALALAQGGAAALALPLLARARRGAGGLATVGRRAYPVFLLHQVVFAVVWLGTLRLGPLPGLHEGPGTPGWLAARICWLPLMAGVLLLAARDRPGRRRLAPGTRPR